MSIVAENKLEFIQGIAPSTVALSEENKAQASQTLETTPLPTTRVEAWKYTRVAKLGKVNYTNAASTIDAIEKWKIDANAPTFVFVNGHFSAEHSSIDTPEGITCKLLSECTTEELSADIIKNEGEIFHSINTNYLNDGVHIAIADKAVVDQPIQIIHILKGEAQLSNFKTIITAGAFSKAAVIQGFFAEDAAQSFANNTTSVHVAKNAFLTIDKVQYESDETAHISTEQVKQADDSTFTINTVTLNGGLVRNNLNIDVEGQNCTTNLNGGYILKNKQHVDNHTVVDHIVPNCNSNELYKGVMDDKSTAVFNGKVFVRQDAQKINAFQSNGNVLLSDDASINSKPELEIYADDVKCSHGSTTGQLDEDAVFYLRARGLSEKSARQLMVAAFVSEVFEQIENEDVMNYINGLLSERCGWTND